MISKLICLGDSLTEGYNIDSKDNWVHLLAQEVSFPIINEGISGDTTSGMLARFHSEVKTQQPSHMIFMGGSNDCSLNIPTATILGNILALSRHAKRIQCQIIIGIPTSSFWDESPLTLSAFLNPKDFKSKLTDLQNALRSFAKEDDLEVIDFSEILSKEHFLDDGVHPNEAGQILMKNHVSQALKKLSLQKF